MIFPYIWSKICSVGVPQKTFAVLSVPKKVENNYFKCSGQMLNFREVIF